MVFENKEIKITFRVLYANDLRISVIASIAKQSVNPH
jgi:hypothetical protein